MGCFTQGPRTAKIALWKFPVTSFCGVLGSVVMMIWAGGGGQNICLALVFSNWLSKTETQHFIKCSLGFQNAHGKRNRQIKRDVEEHRCKTFSLPRTAKSLEPFSLTWAAGLFLSRRSHLHCKACTEGEEAEMAAALLVKSCHEIRRASCWQLAHPYRHCLQSWNGTERKPCCRALPLGLLHPWREPHLYIIINPCP